MQNTSFEHAILQACNTLYSKTTLASCIAVVCWKGRWNFGCQKHVSKQ